MTDVHGTHDESQLRVHTLDPSQHARVLGAPGSGKTGLLVESFARVVSLDGWDEHEVLVLAPNRLVASRLRDLVARRVERAMGGSPVRTASSFAFSILDRAAALAGRAPVRLLTGTVHDETIADIVNERLAQGSAGGELAPEVLLSAPFRAELRELSRLVDDYGIDPDALRGQLDALTDSARRSAYLDGQDAGMQSRWAEGVRLVTEVNARLRATRSDELSASSMVRLAAQEIRDRTVAAPKLVLVDDAQELGEGALALLAACASVGSSIWAFGDPDVATGAFQGERTRVLAGLTPELERRGLIAPATSREQFVQLEHVYRHGPEIRGLVRELTRRIGAAGVGTQREAVSARASAGATSVQFARAESEAEQIGIIAHRMRERKLGIDGARNPLSWGDMAVICRSRSEATRVSRLLAAHQVPSGVSAGGIVLREHQIVRELITLLQHACDINPLDAGGVLALAGGVIGGLDPVAVRRLRGALLIHERRAVRDTERDAASIEELVYEAFSVPGSMPVIDSAGGRVLRRLGLIAAEGRKVYAAGGTAREVLWAIWDGTRLASRWQDEALVGRGVRADEANRSLDAVLGLFFALQRHEEQASTQPIEELLTDLLSSTVPEDSLAQQSAHEMVTVTTPQGVVGQEFSLVSVLGVQDGVWPNLRARGSLLGTAALERLLRGEAAQQPSRRDTIHDELRLFAHACARARDELLVVCISDEENFPSPFFGFGRAHDATDLPHSRLTLRGITAQARRVVVAERGDAEFTREAAAHTLAVLAGRDIPGAHPDDWYGMLPPSTTTPLFAVIKGEEPRKIPVSPSQLERAETCPLDWAIASLGGGSGNVAASLGTLVHHALETVPGHAPEDFLVAIMAEWNKLQFDASWESERMRRTATQMAEGLAHYLREFEASDRELLGRESRFSLEIGAAELRGQADRIEQRVTPTGTEITVIDLKTGRTPATKNEAEAHVQMQAYQLGVTQGAFERTQNAAGMQIHTAAKLLYVHPDATKGKGFVERAQTELSEEARHELVERVTAAATVMAAGEFTARIEHHCSDPHKPGNCRLHIIQAVSHA